MRRLLCWLLTAAMLPALCACAPEPPSDEENGPPPATEPEAPPETAEPENPPPPEDYEAVDWLVFSITPEDYGIEYGPDLPDWSAFPLDKLGVYCMYSDGVYSEGSYPHLYQRFMDAPDTVLHYLALIGNHTIYPGTDWERDAVQTLCSGIASTDANWADVCYPNDIRRFSRIIEQYRQLYPNGRIAEILDALQEARDAYGYMDAAPEGQSPEPVLPDRAADWQVLSLHPEDYGIAYDTESMDVGGFPLAKLCVYYLYSDGAYAESAQDEVYRRFTEAPHTVLHFLSLLGDRTARGGQTGEETAADELCRAIAFADVFWYEDTGELTAIIERYRAIYKEGRAAEILSILQAERDNAAAMLG